MVKCPSEAALMVVGYLNSNIADPEGNGRDKAILEELLNVVL